METFDLATKTLYADFQESVALRFRLEEAPGDTFVKKQVKNKTYWYRQSHDKQKNQQAYFGPANEKNTRYVEEQRQSRKKRLQQIRSLVTLERRKIPILKKAGLVEIDRKSAKILHRFSRLRVTFEHGVLIGSMAFPVYSGILGFKFDHQLLKTDIDVARNESDGIAVTTTDALFAEVAEGLYAIPGLDHLNLPSSFLYQREIKIDFLVPMLGKERRSYRFPGISGLGAQALRYLDFLLEERVNGLLLSPSRAIPVTVAHPARFALHKMLVGVNRSDHEKAKQAKDFHQASQLIIACAQEMPEALKKAISILHRRGNKWARNFERAKRHITAAAREHL